MIIASEKIIKCVFLIISIIKKSQPSLLLFNLLVMFKTKVNKYSLSAILY
jgi:hypothetical protein